VDKARETIAPQRGVLFHGVKVERELLECGHLVSIRQDFVGRALAAALRGLDAAIDGIHLSGDHTSLAVNELANGAARQAARAALTQATAQSSPSRQESTPPP
jgi:hypothetical protein